MTSEKLDNSLKNLHKAMNRFSEALQEPESSIVRDASIQRFEFTYELLWKTLKVFLQDIHGVRAVSPRQVFKEAYSLAIIKDEEIFLEMMQARNLLSHTYNEDQAIDIYKKCKRFLSAIEQVYKAI